MRIVEHRRAEQLQHAVGVRSIAQFFSDYPDIATVHFARIEQGRHRLILQCVGAAVPEQAALRHHVASGLTGLIRCFLHTRRVKA